MHSSTEPQNAPAVMMIRPVRFEANYQTTATNAFQHPLAIGADEAQALALAEFDGLCAALREAGVEVCVYDDTAEPHTPDAIFPNNWLTTHADGTAVLYPMMAENRRLERRPELLERLGREHGFAVSRVIDLSHHEHQGRFLEGTGSMVLDRVNRVAYACVGPRTDVGVLEEFCRELGYLPFSFEARDATGIPIYHTNVMMCLGARFAVVCLDSVDSAVRREQLAASLRESGHEVVSIDGEQLRQFAGNMMALRDERGETVLAMSTRAYNALRPEQLSTLAAHSRIVASPVNTIEDCAGGGVRCMLASLHLPRSAKPAAGKSLQETYAPHNACFGCGPANPRGLHVRSFPRGEEVVAEWEPEPHHEAFPGVLCGGIIGTLLDCHCNWTAAWHLMRRAGAERPPCTVTADYAITLRRPTPTDGPVHLRAEVVEASEARAVIHGELLAGDRICATCRGTFVAVQPGHPAYHRW